MNKRQEAASAFNRCWELLELPASPERDNELVQQSLASRAAWREVGQSQEFAIADWMVSRAYVATGQSTAALLEAEQAVSQSSEAFPCWLQASLYEGLARAQQSCGLTVEALASAKECRRLLTLEPDLENFELITAQLAELGI